MLVLGRTVFGKGFTYAFHLQDVSVNREDIDCSSSSHEFSQVIFAIMHHGRHWLIDIQLESAV